MSSTDNNNNNNVDLSGVGTEANPITTDKVNAEPGLIDQMSGGLQQALGNLTGNRVLQEQGVIQKTEGAGAEGGLTANVASELKDAAAASNK